MNDVVAPIVTIAMGIIGIAFLSVLLSKNAQTSSVLSAFGNMFSNMLGSATAPVTQSGAGFAQAPALNMGNNQYGGWGGFGIQP